MVAGGFEARRVEVRGRAEGAELLLLGMLESRLGPVPAAVRTTLDLCPIDTLRALAATAATCPSIEAFGAVALELAPAA